MEKKIINGITWNHSRGYTPLVAAAQRFMELHPDVEINWKKRTLQEFADFPIEKLAEKYDMMVIDHPWVGFASYSGAILPLDEWISPELLGDLEANSVGQSYTSYVFNNHLWALPIDAATPVASYRADLLRNNGIPLPQDWNEVLDLAKKGKVAAPGIEVDVLMNFYMFCQAAGETPFCLEDKIVSHDTGLKALETMRSFYSLLDKRFFGCNPIAVAEIMSSTDEYWFCPFTYGYSNYARNGYAKCLLTFCDLVTLDGQQLSSTLGGTGLAVSAHSAQAETAVCFADFVSAPNQQISLFTHHGGQPAYKQAWQNPLNNTITNNYFKNTLPALERAFLRPRYNGYLQFQDYAGAPLQQYLKNGGNETKVLNKMNELYRDSFINQYSNADIYA